MIVVLIKFRCNYYPVIIPDTQWILNAKEEAIGALRATRPRRFGNIVMDVDDLWFDDEFDNGQLACFPAIRPPILKAELYLDEQPRPKTSEHYGMPGLR